MFQLLGNPPFFTFCVFTLCVVVLLFRPNVVSTCLLPQKVLTSLQPQRLFLYPFVHVGFFHILLNMLAWMTMAKDFEHTVGTLPALYTVLVLLIPCNTILMTASAYVVDFVFRTSFRTNCTVGLSGVLFSILVVNLRLSGQSHASFFGFFPIPIHIYPYILALLIQLLFPGSSIIGHVAGILSGTALTHGWLRAVTPSDERFDDIENRLRLTRLPAWQPVPSMFGQLLQNVADHLLPGLSGTNPPPSFRQRTANAWRSLSAWFSSSNPNAQQNNNQSQVSYAPSSSPRVAGVYDSSGQASSASERVFSGTGHTLGGGSVSQPRGHTVGGPLATQPRGRVPPTSRLLQLDEQRSKQTNSVSDSDYGATAQSTNGKEESSSFSSITFSRQQ